MIVARAPTRICLVGGGTDVNPYAYDHQGAIVNVAINKYHHVTLIPRFDRRIIVNALSEIRDFDLDGPYEYGKDLSFDLVRAIIDSFRNDFLSGFALCVQSDVPNSCGLGTSGSVAVALVGVFNKWTKKGMSREDIARLAFEIETKKLGWAGGKQDQWAAAYGGLNITFFGPKENVEVFSLGCDKEKNKILRQWLQLFYIGGSRASSSIQVSLQAGMRGDDVDRKAAFDDLKDLALKARLAIEQDKMRDLGELVHRGWEAKKRSNPIATNERIDTIYRIGRQNGALGGKLLGAGGAGYLVFVCPPQAQKGLAQSVAEWAAFPVDFEFDMSGLMVTEENLSA